MYNHNNKQAKSQNFARKASFIMLPILALLSLLAILTTKASLSHALAPITPPTTPPTTPPQVSPTPTPTIPVTPPIPACSKFGKSILDQSIVQSNGRTLLTSNWTSFNFYPNNNGKLDKIQLYVSGTGTIELQTTDNNGRTYGSVSKNINGTGAWTTFDFINEKVINNGSEYTVSFRLVSGKVFFRHLDNNPVRKIFIKPCAN